MSRRVQIDGIKMLEADGGIVWGRETGLRKSERGKYVAELYGVTYELEKRRWSPQEPGDDTGWYLFSTNVYGGFFGARCASTIVEAVDVATEMILTRDLRKDTK